jgi:hypothetical protein
MAMHERNPGTTGAGAQTTNLHLFDPATRVLQRTVTVPANLFAYTLRVFDGHIAGLYTQDNTTRCRVWDTNFAEVSDFQVAPIAATHSGRRAMLSVYTDPATGIEMGIGVVGDEAFVIARGYQGVVPYANFEDASCAQAIKDLALITMSLWDVDENRSGSLRGRGSEDAQRKAQPIPIAAPLECEEWPIFEFYRTSCTVTGQTEDGEGIEETAGDTGDSAHRLDLDSVLITTPGVAASVALQYVNFLGTPRRQIELTVRETGDLIRPLDYIDFDGALWLVVEAALDVDRRTYRLRAMEAA